MHDTAALAFLADFLAGKDSILLAGSNAEAADLTRRVQERLTPRYLKSWARPTGSFLPGTGWST